MKKILYIVPILVFAMVALTQGAKAQTGQTGNASDGGVQAVTGAAINGALNSTVGGNNNQGGGNTVTNGGTASANAPDAISQEGAGGGDGNNDGGGDNDQQINQGGGAFPPLPGTPTGLVTPGAPVTLTTAGWLPGELITITYPDSFTLA